MPRQLSKIGWPCVAIAGSTGCSRSPSIEFIGTFFPVWMCCILIALAITGLFRVALARWGVEKNLGPLVLFYPSLMVAFSCLLWLIWFS